MKTKILIAIVVLQVAVLGWMAGEREWVRQNGRTVYFRTAPVDPRDVMRGDYVRLRYGMSTVPREQWRGDLKSTTNNPPLPRDTRVYASIQIDTNNLVQLTSLGTDQPADGAYVRGRVVSSSPTHLQVRYGLEAWFLEQGSGKIIEARQTRDGIQVPLEMEAGLNPSGLAVLKDYRWCPMGIGLTLVTTNITATNRIVGARLVSGTVQLLNASSNDLAIVDLPNQGSLRLEPVVTWSPDIWRWTRGTDTPAADSAAGARVRVLKPSEIHEFQVSFADPRWTVQRGAESRLLSDLPQDWNTQFRFVYRPPDAAACAQLPDAHLIWHGELATRAFTPAGARID